VPYGHYSNQRPGGQTQYDVNVTMPLDVWQKRQARTRVAKAAKKVTEAQFQDAVRIQIDNLYTAYVDVLAARETLRFVRAYAAGTEQMLGLKKKLRSFITPSEIDVLNAQVQEAQLGTREAAEALAKANRSLGLLLRMPHQQTNSLELRSLLRDVRPLPMSEQDLVKLGASSRPDLNGYRLGLVRSKADVDLAYANRFSDVYLLYQPYTFQNNSPFGLKSAYSYAFGVTMAVPVFNWNQGNIKRAKINVTQTEFELAHLEQQVEYDVVEAVREFNLSLQTVIELEHEVVPIQRKVLDRAYKGYTGGETSLLEYLEAQREYNERVKRWHEALVRHRRAMLDLNTAVGAGVFP
jgi:cobalt-zinc-cadmium efflux system outer membrane protein